MISALVVFMSLAIVGVPNSRALFCLYISAFVIGTCAGAWSNAKTVWLIEIWQKRSAPVLHLCSFLFGIGTIIGPLLEECHLTGEVQIQLNATNLDNGTSRGDPSLTNQTSEDPAVYELSERRAKLMIPFLIIGSMQFIGESFHVMFTQVIREGLSLDHQ